MKYKIITSVIKERDYWILLSCVTKEEDLQQVDNRKDRHPLTLIISLIPASAVQAPNTQIYIGYIISRSRSIYTPQKAKPVRNMPSSVMAIHFQPITAWTFQAVGFHSSDRGRRHKVWCLTEVLSTEKDCSGAFLDCLIGRPHSIPSRKSTAIYLQNEPFHLYINQYAHHSLSLHAQYKRTSTRTWGP